MNGEDGGGDGGEHDRGDRPVVTDDEVVPEPHEALQRPHRMAIWGDMARRIHHARPSESAVMPAISPRSAASLPGQDTPAPSPAQKMPNETSMTPTPNFSAFSGTRESGAWMV